MRDWSRIGASDIPAIAGIEKYGGFVKLITRLRFGQKDDEEIKDNDPRRLGHQFEDIIIHEAARRLGAQIVNQNRTEVHPQLEMALATPDAIMKKDDKYIIVEAKRLDYSRKDDFGEDEFDQIPQEYYLQVQWQKEVFRHYIDIDKTYLAVLFGNRGIELYEVQDNPELRERLCIMVKDFWQKYIIDKQMPEVRAGIDIAAYQEFLKLAKPNEFEQEKIEIPVDGEEFNYGAQLIARYKQLKQQQKEIETEIENVQKLALMYFGRPVSLKTDDGSINISLSKGKEYVDVWELYRYIKEKDPKLIEKFKKTTESKIQVNFRIRNKK